jgi:hypothetical protein
MNPQLRRHFRRGFTTIEPQLHRMLLERLVKLLPGPLGFDHRCIHTGIVFGCLSLPVAVKSAQPQFFLSQSVRASAANKNCRDCLI